MPTYIVLLGPPGAGKGTQAQIISEKMDLPHISSGDIFRENIKGKTELGQLAKGYMDRGELVPDKVTVRMLRQRLLQPDCAGGAILDGFPRTVVQAQELNRELQRKSKRIDAVVNLVIDDSVIEKRVTGRRSCPVCGAVYHIDALKPKTEGYCDKCKNQQLVQRPDDKPDVIRQRLKTYHEQTSVVVGFYIDNGQEVIDIDADRPINDVTAKILEKLGSLAAAG